MGGFNDCCPEIPDITQNSYTYNIEGLGLEMVVTDLNPVDPTQKVVTLQVVGDTGAPVAGYFRIHCWFQDIPQPTGEKSAAPPTTPGTNEFDVVTESDGSIDVPVMFAGNVNAWYLAASAGGPVVVSPAITLGT